MKVSELAKSLGYRLNEFAPFVEKLGIGIRIEGSDIPFNISQAIRQKVPHRKNLNDGQLAELKAIQERVKSESDKKKAKAAEKRAARRKQPDAEEAQAPAVPTAPKESGGETKKPRRGGRPPAESPGKKPEAAGKPDEKPREKQSATFLQPQVIIEEIQTKEKKKRDELKESILNVKENLLNVRAMGNVTIDYVDSGTPRGSKISEYRHSPKTVKKQFRTRPFQRHKRSGFPGAGRTEQQKPAKPTKLTVSVPVLLREFSEQSGIKIKAALSTLRKSNRVVDSDSSLTEDDVILLGLENGIDITTVKKATREETVMEGIRHEQEDVKLATRPPVVTVMGHVDHGKTTLLDYIRKSRVAQREAGGITQCIGATTITTHSGKKITFIDTPGHEAFTAMRLRGANVTDVVILVVAADEGVMPQTVEALNHAKEAKATVIVAINKIDKPGAQPERVMRELSKYGLIPEKWGGKTIFQEVSAVTGKGVDQLLEMILLQSDMLDLKADSGATPRGVVLEATKSGREGAKATLLVQNGTLKKGDVLVIGGVMGRVREMFGAERKPVPSAGPSEPVEVLGLDGVPEAGDKFFRVANVKIAAELVREKKGRPTGPARSGVKSLEDLMSEVKEVKLIIKCDNRGSVEAITGAVEKLHAQNIKVKIIHSDVGLVTESDILLASASGAVILTFNVVVDPKAVPMQKNKMVQVKEFSVIYDLLDEVKKLMAGLIEPEFSEVLIGTIEVRQVFKISRLGAVAGCYVVSGKAVRGAACKIKRAGKVIHEGKITSLKRFKDDVKEVQEKFECGLSVSDFTEFNTRDVLEVYEQIEVRPAEIV